MPSTYSPSLRLELIGPGEQAGTWNTTTNTNLGTLLDSAIAGYTTVSVIAANQAFTALDGAADQARNAVIELTTTTGAAFAVYAPPQEKTYIIFNNSAHTATIYNSTVLGNTTAAGAGVAISPGSKVMVFSNGTNFTALTTGTVTSVGGTGTVNGISLTGTVTSSGNLTLGGALSGVSLATQVTGTLPVANGGTGTTTPSLVDGSGISVTGTWPNQTITATGGGGTVTSVGTAGTVNGLTLTGGPITGTGTITLGGSLSGTAAGLSIGGNAATATAASTASFASTAGTASSASTATTASAATTLNTGNWLGYQASASLAFAYSGTPRATLDSSGNWAPSGYTYGTQLFINTFSQVFSPTPSKCNILYSGSGENGMALQNSTATTQNAILFVNNAGSNVGACFCSTTGTTFATSSDYRLKNSIAPMTGALAKVALLKPCTYKWNSDNSDSQGFIAHELQAVVPECVTGEKDAVFEDGSIKSQGIDTSFLVATLTAAIQELKALVDAQAARIATLESR
jgi:hypothetical protein